MTAITIGIYHYPSALKSAIYGLEEMFLLANRFCQEQSIDLMFEPIVIEHNELIPKSLNLVLLPPGSNDEDYLSPHSELIDWLRFQHTNGAVLAAACAGVFIIGSTGLIGKREVTTHWALSDTFSQKFPGIRLNASQILFDHGDLITAGGMMSWIDLGFRIIAKYSSLNVVRQLGKTLVIDTASRQQRYYQQFAPSLSHGDAAIVAIQQQMNLKYQEEISIAQLAKNVALTERTMQRRFAKATGYNPIQYLQRLRIQKACDYLESTKHSFASIAHQVGYEDVSACRKVFVKIIGLTPGEFRKRFV